MNLEQIRALIGFDEHSNLPKAAASLGLSKKTLRGRLTALEREVGVALLRREGRSLVLTAAGAELARGGRGLLREADAAIEWVANQSEELSGSFRVAIPIGLPPPLLVMVLRHGHMRFPKLRSQVFPVARPLALLPDEADIALTFEPRPEEGPWLSARLVQATEGLFASPDYLAREGTPERVDDLQGHSLFSWTPPTGGPEAWPRSDGGTFIAPLSHCSPDVGLIRQCALAGLGIARFPTGAIPNPETPAGALVPVLPEIFCRRLDVRAVIPDTPRMRRPFLTFFGNVREGVKALPNG
jgi:DNA-binding transcriptional LysR family regulator